jgi:hypothetical protein
VAHTAHDQILPSVFSRSGRYFLRREVSSKLTGSIYPGHIKVIHKSAGRAKVKLRLALGVNEIKMRLLYMMDGDQHRRN